VDAEGRPDAEMRCVVCGRPLHPGGDNVAFGVGGRVLFAAHAGACASIVRQTRAGAVQLGSAWLRARAPKLHEGLQLASEAFRRAIDRR